jgi:hypothetical protein
MPRMSTGFDVDGLTMGQVLEALTSAIVAGAPLDSAIVTTRLRKGGLSEVTVEWPSGVAGAGDLVRESAEALRDAIS